MFFHRTMVAIGLCLIIGAALAAERSATESVTYTLLRSGTSLGTHPTEQACTEALNERRQLDASRTSGQIRFVCRTDHAVTVQYGPSPTCPTPPPDQTQPGTCPAGTEGSWTQTGTTTYGPAPACVPTVTWRPVTPPDGACRAVPPPPLPAPTGVTATALSTSAIRVNWNVVADALGYSLERCIGATCTTFSQLVCVTGLTGTHSGLPANLTARYRVRASRDATCGTAAGNLGAYSAIVSGTTLTAATPVNCVVSEWSAWAPGPWSTCSGGQQSSTETHTRTITTQPANGGAACPALTETRTVTQACTSTTIPRACASRVCDVSWTPDGPADGFRIFYSRTDGTWATAPVQVAGSVTRTDVTMPDVGIWYFAVKSFIGGTESALSNVVVRDVQ